MTRIARIVALKIPYMLRYMPGSLNLELWRDVIGIFGIQSNLNQDILKLRISRVIMN